MTAPLSPREAEVLKLYGSERVSAIARRLRLSVKTVSTHLSNAQEKMGLETRHQLLRAAMEVSDGQG